MAATTTIPFDLTEAKKVYGALLIAGVPGNLIDTAFHQSAMESNGFRSAIYKDDNNASGVLYTASLNSLKLRKQKNSTPSLKHRLTDSGMSVAHFATVQDWAIDFVRILNIGVKPIAATTETDYFARLKTNNYFGAETAAGYQKKVDAWATKMQPYISDIKKKTLTA